MIYRLILENGDIVFIGQATDGKPTITSWTGPNGHKNEYSDLRAHNKLVNRPVEGFRIAVKHPALPYEIVHPVPVQRIQQIAGIKGETPWERH